MPIDASSTGTRQRDWAYLTKGSMPLALTCRATELQEETNNLGFATPDVSNTLRPSETSRYTTNQGGGLRGGLEKEKGFF